MGCVHALEDWFVRMELQLVVSSEGNGNFTHFN